MSFFFRTTKTATYFEEYPVQLMNSFKENTGHTLNECIILVLEYGKNFSGPSKDVFHTGRSVGQASRAHKSNFLHPVFYYYLNIATKQWPKSPVTSGGILGLPIPDRLHHTVEDFLGVWDTPHTHILPLRRFIEYCTHSDLRSVLSSTCFVLMMTHTSFPLSCQDYLHHRGLTNPASAY